MAGRGIAARDGLVRIAAPALLSAALIGCTTHVHMGSKSSSSTTATSTSTTTTTTTTTKSKPSSSASPSTTSSTQATTPTVTGATASIVVKVDCGADGAALVSISYGTAPAEQHEVGARGVPSFRGRYGIVPGYADSPLKVTTQPSRGTCKTTLTAYRTTQSSGDVIGEIQSSDQTTLSAVVSAGR